MKDRQAKLYKNNHSHDPTLDGEVMTARHLPGEIPKTILDYIDNDFSPISKDYKQPNLYSSFRIFGSKFVVKAELEELGALVLRGQEKDVAEVLRIVKKNRLLLFCPLVAKDPVGREITGTLIQLAAMAGDIKQKKEGIEEKDQSLVERLIKAGNLSDAEAIEQLECIFSKKAKEVTEARNKKYIGLIENLGNSLIQLKEYGAYSKKYKRGELVKNFKNGLEKLAQERIYEGYIFDPLILSDACHWFRCNVNKFSDSSDACKGWWSAESDTYWVNGFGLLQSKLCARNAQIILTGPGLSEAAPRVLTNFYGKYFYDTTSGLGIDFYIGFNEKRKDVDYCDRGFLADVSIAGSTYYYMSENNKCFFPQKNRCLIM